MSNAAVQIASVQPVITRKDIRALLSSFLKDTSSFFEQDGTLSLRFSTSSYASEILETLYNRMTTASSFTNPMFWHLEHAWWPVIKPLFCYSDGKEMQKSGATVRYVNVGGTDTDSFVSSFYNKIGITNINGVPRLLNEDTWVLGDMRVSQHFDESLLSEIECYYNTVKNYSDFNPSEFIKEFLEVKAPFEVKISWQDNSILQQNFQNYF